MSFVPIIPATLELDPQGVPVSSQFGDVYHSASGALDQARHVFLRGNGLPARWQGRQQFVVVETGFGLGHNFLATWEAWRDDPAACTRLHFVSVEKHPFNAHDMAAAHAKAGAPADLSARLIRHWPMLLPGFHRLEFSEANGRSVCLTLMFGEASDWLAQCVATADAIYLDGFAPAKNPAMWSPEVFNALARLADSVTTLATWSVSSAVRKALTDAGFAVEKTQGFTGKREMLTGRFETTRTARSSEPRDAIVIGAGLAGTALCERLAARGWRLQLLESRSAPAQGASGNLAGAFRPLPSRDDNLMARITRAGFLFGLHDLARLAEVGEPVRWAQCGVLHLARDAAQARKQADTVATLDAPGEYLQWCDVAAATAHAGQTTAQGGWWFPQAGWINPPSLCAAHLAIASRHPLFSARFDQHVDAVRKVAGQWEALGTDGQVIARAPQLVFANAHDASRLLRNLGNGEWLPLFSARGQVSHLDAAHCAPLNTVVCGSGYVTPAIDGWQPTGATFVVNDPDSALRESEHAENLDKLARMLPDAFTTADAIPVRGRVGHRPVTPDRLPVVGALPDHTRLWLLSGFGARGLVWGALCAELLASLMSGEPLPLERPLTDALSPLRYRSSQS
ncbi:bifunctional tRNA (5-methylaminomethyl-2-thiouridine)(34)-methyltransferase MnmD/FAD-dependent 5-carboxymethylaminomethyl-2-thiouridine(34) oxidoreductase MnmC [Viridibacterium curvum]|uniref:tRNA 5-methylaminomethyl-2-thiouridine biosynthesis bifunctional protein MnmC n=1 Tax=Viridibacterium curvum TaxID=1101404 RepID=A0ABP9QE86_9RHOO